MDLIHHILVYHAIHGIGLVGLAFVVHMHILYKIKLDKAKKIDYTKIVNR